MLLKIQTRSCNKNTYFKDKILAGLLAFREDSFHKIHHICANKTKTFKNIKEDTCIDLYVLERLEQYDCSFTKNKFAQVLYKSIQEIEIKIFDSDDKESYRAEMKIDNKEMLGTKFIKCTKNEGFLFVTRFLDHIIKILPKEKIEGAAIYRGIIVHWTDLKY